MQRKIGLPQKRVCNQQELLPCLLQSPHRLGDLHGIHHDHHQIYAHPQSVVGPCSKRHKSGSLQSTNRNSNYQLIITKSLHLLYSVKLVKLIVPHYDTNPTIHDIIQSFTVIFFAYLGRSPDGPPKGLPGGLACFFKVAGTISEGRLR